VSPVVKQKILVFKEKYNKKNRKEQQGLGLGLEQQGLGLGLDKKVLVTALIVLCLEDIDRF